MPVKFSNKLTASLAAREAAGATLAHLRASDAENLPALRTALAERVHTMRNADLADVPGIGSEVAGIRAAIGEATRRRPTEEAITDARQSFKVATARATDAAREQHRDASIAHWERATAALDSLFAALDAVGDGRAELAMAATLPISDERYDSARNAANVLAQSLGLPLRPWCPAEDRRERAQTASAKAAKAASKAREDSARTPVDERVTAIALAATAKTYQTLVEQWNSTLRTLKDQKSAGLVGPEREPAIREAERELSTARAELARIAKLQEANRYAVRNA